MTSRPGAQPNDPDLPRDIERLGCTPTGCAGALLGCLAGGAWGVVVYRRITARQVAERGFTDLLPVPVLLFALLGMTLGLLTARGLVIVLRRLAGRAEHRRP